MDSTFTKTDLFVFVAKFTLCCTIGREGGLDICLDRMSVGWVSSSCLAATSTEGLHPCGRRKRVRRIWEERGYQSR